MNDRLFIVIGEEHYNPLGVIRSLGINGISPVFIAVKGKSTTSSSSKYVKKNHFVNNIQEAFAVLINDYGDYFKKGTKPFVITTDDDIQEYIDKRYDEVKELFYVFNAGTSGSITKYMNKKAILDLAEKHGLNVLKTKVVERGFIPKDIEYPIITKSISPNIGGWKSDVFICETEQDLKSAFLKIKSPQVLLQRFIEKKNEYCLDGFSIDKGRQSFIPIATTYNYLIRGYYSPYMTVHSFDITELKTAVNDMLREIGFEGIFSIEFLIDQDGTYYFSEINFRNSTWSYIGAKLGMPIPNLWADAMVMNRVDEEWYKPIPEHYTAMVEPIDYAKRVRTGMIEPSDWLRDFRNTNCPFYFDNEDYEPFRIMVQNWDKLS